MTPAALHALFEEAFDAAPAGLIIADAAGYVLRASRRAIELLGRDPIGQLATELDVQLEVKRTQLSDGALLVLVDRREPAALRRLASVGSIAAGLAHDVNNPLAAVIANTSMVSARLELLKAEGADVTELTDALQDVIESGEKISRMVGELRQRARPPSDPIANVPAGTTKRARVLLIDDEDTVLRALARMLRGHDVVTARGGREALDILEGAAGEFDVIFTDLAMADMSGVELFEELRARRPADAPRVVFVTGDVVADEAREFLATVPNGRLEKPVRIGQLTEMIARITALLPR